MAAASMDSTAPEAVVAGHISLDVFPTLYGPVTLEPGGLTVVGPALTSTGGAVANVGLALHRLGVRVALSAKVGHDLFGGALLDTLARHDPGLVEGITVSEDEVTSYTIVVNPPGVDRSFLHCPGANATFAADDVPYKKLDGSRVLHFGYPPLMPLMCADRGRPLHEMFARARARGVATALDLCMPDPRSGAAGIDWPDLLERVLPVVDVFAPSIDELLFMFEPAAHDRVAAGAPLASVLDLPRLRALGRRLTAMGAAVVAIKLGDQGLYLRTARDAEQLSGFCERMQLPRHEWSECEVLSPCFTPRAVHGTTGSGDATIAGLLTALLRGAAPAAAATAATAVGACSVEEVDPTSGVPAWERVLGRIDDGWPRLPSVLAEARGPGEERDPRGTFILGA